MKTATFPSLLALARQVTCSNRPGYQWDPDTADDCIEWFDHGDEKEETCEYVRDYFSITSEQFHKWNPSVNLDCEPWHDFQSYCIVTLERLKNDPPPPMTTPSSTTTTTSTASTSTTPVPSPTAWDDRGCYVETPAMWLLEQKIGPAGGDASLTVPKCKNSCFRAGYKFAGVQEGNKCWCGNSIPGERTSSQADCNTPCSGDSKTFCGGEGLVQVFEVLENLDLVSGTITAAGTDAGVGVTTSTNGASETRSSAGAGRNMPRWW